MGCSELCTLTCTEAGEEVGLLLSLAGFKTGQGKGSFSPVYPNKQSRYKIAVGGQGLNLSGRADSPFSVWQTLMWLWGFAQPSSAGALNLLQLLGCWVQGGAGAEGLPTSACSSELEGHETRVLPLLKLC